MNETTTLQDLLTDIEREAEQKTLAAMRAADLIDRANTLSAQLIEAGVNENSASPAYVYHLHPCRYEATYYDYGTDGAVRRALSSLGIVPITEKELRPDPGQPEGTRIVDLIIAPDINIWLCRDPIPLAEAA